VNGAFARAFGLDGACAMRANTGDRHTLFIVEDIAWITVDTELAIIGGAAHTDGRLTIFARAGERNARVVDELIALVT
jgi:hypothetical protein